MDSEEEILEQFLESESDDEKLFSSSEDDTILMLGCALLKDSRTTIKNYVEEVIPKYSETEFLSHLRIRRSMFQNLCERFKSSSFFSDRDAHGLLSPEKNMAIFLWFIGHQTTSYHDVANQFDVCLSTAHTVIGRVSQFLCDLAPEVIKWPTVEQQQEISMFFNTTKGFPNVAGCIDGSHILIDKPNTEYPDSYINRKGYYSIQIQIVCDNKKKIRDIFLGYPGSVHDARVFANSKTLLLCSKLPENGKYILGDSAYPCLQYLLTPYKDNGYLTANKKNFNKQLSSCRVFVEHTIGILKQRFRQLYHLKTRNISLLLHQIKACCVLHNLASEDDLHSFEEQEITSDEEEEEEKEEDNDIDTLNYSKNAGKLLRDLLSSTL